MAASGSINAIPYQPIIDENCAGFSTAYCASGFASTRLNYFGYCIGLWDFSQITTMYQSVDTSSGVSADNQTLVKNKYSAEPVVFPTNLPALPVVCV